MPKPSAGESTPERSGSLTIAEMLADLTWEQVTADGVITIEEVDAMLRAKGLDPNEFDYLYK